LPLVLSVLLLGAGFHVQTYLATSSCDMTWSGPEYTAVPVPESPSGKEPSPYALYRFSDRRRPLAACSAPAVLYVPGHWGSHEQARSLGAHGVGLGHRRGQGDEDPAQARYAARPLQEVLEEAGLPHAPLHAPPHNMYSVYALDFNGEASAAHGSFLARQTDFLVRSIGAIHAECPGSPPVTLVGHSVGGVVARAAYSSPLWAGLAAATPGGKPVGAIVTLAAPHRHSPLALDASARRWWKQAQESPVPKSVFKMSVGGGPKDELVPAELTDWPGALNVRAADLAGRLGFSLDHRAIVWCRDVMQPLGSVLELLHALPEDASSREKVELVQKMLRLPERGGGAQG
jgi:hypothetical protein